MNSFNTDKLKRIIASKSATIIIVTMSFLITSLPTSRICLKEFWKFSSGNWTGGAYKEESSYRFDREQA